MCLCVGVCVCVVHVCLKSDASLTYSNRFAATVCGRRDRHCCCDVLKVVEAFIGTNTFLKRGKDKKGKHVHKKKVERTQNGQKVTCEQVVHHLKPS